MFSKVTRGPRLPGQSTCRIHGRENIEQVSRLEDGFTQYGNLPRHHRRRCGGVIYHRRNDSRRAQIDASLKVRGEHESREIRECDVGRKGYLAFSFSISGLAEGAGAGAIISPVKTLDNDILW